jgi:hypothetical protein
LPHQGLLNAGCVNSKHVKPPQRRGALLGFGSKSDPNSDERDSQTCLETWVRLLKMQYIHRLRYVMSFQSGEVYCQVRESEVDHSTHSFSSASLDTRACMKEDTCELRFQTLPMVASAKKTLLPIRNWSSIKRTLLTGVDSNARKQDMRT